jgi:hypothetical protein
VGYELEQAAVASLTPAFVLDPGFGGSATPATLRLRVPPQRAANVVKRIDHHLAIDATTSAPGLCRVRVVARGHVVAHSQAPVYRSGHQRLPIYLTDIGRRMLRRAHHLRVTVSARFRDLVGSDATATATGVLS